MFDFWPSRPLRIASLVKQIPKFDEMELSPDGRLVRGGVELHMNDYCRRAVRTGCELALASEGTCTAITLGPPEADSVLREAILCGCAGGLHVSDPAFAGSDTLATATALAAALDRHGPWDLVLCGRHSIDADTGQVPAQLAELLGLPLLTGVRELTVDGEEVAALLEHNDEWIKARVDLPAVLSCAERLCDPCKIKEPEAWATVDASLIRAVTAADLGAGPWGQVGSPTTVGAVRTLDVERAGERLDGNQAGITRVVEVVGRRLADPRAEPEGAGSVPQTRASGPAVWVVVEPDRKRTTGELLGAAAVLAAGLDGMVVAAGPLPGELEVLSAQGADRVVVVDRADGADLARVLAERMADDPPWAVLAPGTDWGRQVAGRLAVRLGAGLTGDAVGVEARAGRLVALKPAFGGRLVAEITCSSPVQMATVRPGVLPLPDPRLAVDIPVETHLVEVGSTVRVVKRWRDNDSGNLGTAGVVIGVGQGVEPSDYEVLDGLAARIGAVVGATRKVTDRGWMPRARQIGITGHSIAPALYLAVGTSGRFNHMIGARSAGTVVGVNTDPDCELWDWCDVGVVGDWREVLEALIPRLAKLGIGA